MKCLNNLIKIPGNVCNFVRENPKKSIALVSVVASFAAAYHFASLESDRKFCRVILGSAVSSCTLNTHNYPYVGVFSRSRMSPSSELCKNLPALQEKFKEYCLSIL